MQIIIKPIKREKWHGKSGKESFTRPSLLNALVDSEKMEYCTGLNYQDKTFKDVDNPDIMITEAEYYSKLLKQDLSNRFNPNIPHPFWDSRTATVKLENNTIIFNTSNPLEFIKFKICKASKFVANSLKEYEEGLFPYATHYIFDELEEVEKLATKTEQKNKATVECSLLSRERKLQLLLIVGNKDLSSKSDNFIIVEIDKLISENPKEILDFLQKDKEDVGNLYLIKKAIEDNIIKKQGHKITYFESIIGTDIQSAAEYISKDENQDLKLRILSQLKN